MQSSSMNSQGISRFQNRFPKRLIGVFLFCGLIEWQHIIRNYTVNAILLETRNDIIIDENMCRIQSKISPFSTKHDGNMCLNPNSFGPEGTRDTLQHITKNNDMSQTGKRSIGQLRPSDLPLPETFTDFSHTSSMVLPGKIEPQTIHHGTIQQINPIDTRSGDNKTIGTTDIMYLPKIMNIDEIQKVLALLRNFHRFDEDPDTVDGMTTHEIFVDSPDLQQIMNQYHHHHQQHQRREPSEPITSMKIRDYDSATIPERIQLRSQLQAILQPILTERITPLLRTQYSHLCSPEKKLRTNSNDASDRSCTPCYSLIRRYRHGERQSHGTHYDGHALMTVVVSFSNYSTDYNGGLYVSTGYGQRQFVPLYSGDGIAHRSTLLHGVQVLPKLDDVETTERWSWILWYRDSTTCMDYSYEWFVDCAKQGDAICQELYATKIGNVPNTVASPEHNTMNEHDRVTESIVYWNRASAEQGNGNAAIKMARAYLKLLPSTLQYNQTEAIRYYKLAMTSQHPDGYYGMANLYIESLHNKPPKDPKQSDTTLLRVVRLLEEASIRGHPYAMFNLGIVHCYGYGIHQIDTDLAALWFIQSGLPEGYYVAAHQAASMGNITRHQYLDNIARKLGFYEPWRQQARERTGSGGAGGVNLNMKWPISDDGRRPPSF